MTSVDSAKVDQQFLSNAMASFVQIGAVFILLLWCFFIIRPFGGLVIWGLIMAVAIYPAHQSLALKLGGRDKTAMIILVLLGLAILLVPTWLLTESTITALRTIAGDAAEGSITVPPPNPAVADWPLVGGTVHTIWASAASNLEATINQFEPQLREFGQWALKFAGSTALGVLAFVASIIIAGVFVMSAKSGHRVAHAIFTSLAGDRGPELADLSTQTIRSVTKGVLGVAIIQAILSAVGLIVMDIPAAGIWAGVILVLAIMQLPPLLVLAPIAIWVFSVAEPIPATIFGIYALLVSMSDAVLKPMLLGRGVEVPMLVILIGAIGGAMRSGIIGLFIGAVILALGYKLIVAWMAPDDPAESAADG